MKNPVQKLGIKNPRTKRANTVRAWKLDFEKVPEGLHVAKEILDALFGSINCGSTSQVAVMRMRRVAWEAFKESAQASPNFRASGQFRVCVNKEHEAFLLSATDPARVIRSLEAARV